MTKAQATAAYEAALESYRAASRVERAARREHITGELVAAGYLATQRALTAASKACDDAEKVLIGFSDASSYGDP